MPDFTGARPWMRGLLAKITASSATLGPAELLVDEQGNVYGGNGGVISGLKRLLRIDETSTAINTAIASAVQNGAAQALPAESGYSGGWVDSTGHIALGITLDGTVVPYKIQLPSAVTTLMMQSMPAESGWVWGLVGTGGRVALGVGIDGTVTIPKLALTDGSISLTKLAASIQSALPVATPVEGGWVLPVTDTSGRTAGGWRSDGSFEAKVRKPLDYTRTTLDTTSYTIVGDFDPINQTHRLRILRKSDGQMIRVGASTVNVIDPRLSADGTKLLFRTDAPYSPLLLDRPNNNLPQGVPAKVGPWRNVSVPIDGSSNALTDVVSIALFLGLGDSLTNGTGSSVGGGYLPFLETLTGLPGYNFGIGGQTSVQIAARFNSPPATMTVTGNSIPTSGSVVLTAISAAILHNSADLGQTMTGALNGVHGTLTYSTSGADAASAYSFAADVGSLSSPASCPAGSSFLTDIGEQYKIAILISWPGRNDPTPYNQSVTASQAAIAHLSPIGKRYVVMTVINGLGEPGSTSPAVQTINPSIISTFPNNYIEIRKGLVGGSDGLTSQALWPGGPVLQSAMAYNTLTLTSQDTADVGMDTISTSLRTNTPVGAALALSAAGDTVTKAAHGLSNGNRVQLSNIVSATGVTASTAYFVVGAATNTFQLSLTSGGSAVDITADGTADVVNLDVVHLNDAGYRYIAYVLSQYFNWKGWV